MPPGSIWPTMQGMQGMLSITGLGRLPAPTRKPASPSASTGFHVANGRAAAPEAAAATQQANAPSAPDSPIVQDSAARRHGTDLLDALANLQRDLLGTPNPTHLQHLAAFAQNIPAAANPTLRATLREIAVRAEVELARQEMAPPHAPAT